MEWLEHTIAPNIQYFMKISSFYNKKTIFIYKVNQMFKGYTIRKMAWLSIIKNDDYHRLSSVVM